MTELLTSGLVRRFGDAGKWARAGGVAMMTSGMLAAAAAIAGAGGVTAVAIALLCGVPGAMLTVYGRSAGRAVAEEPSINVEMAMIEARRFWIALTLCASFAVLVAIPFSVWPAFQRALRQSRAKTTAAGMEQARVALERYAAQAHSYPNVTTYGDLRHVLLGYGGALPPGDLRYSVRCDSGYCPHYTLASPDGEVAIENGRFARGGP